MKPVLFTFILLLAASALRAQIPSGCVAYYPFNGNFKDSTTKGTNGTNHGAKFSSDRNGFLKKAAIFKAANIEYVDLGSPYSYSSVSFCLWIKPESTTGSKIILSSLANITQFKNTGMELQLTPTDKINVQFGNVSNAPSSYREVTGNTALSNGEWSHIAVTITNMSQVKIYVDGNLDASTTVSGLSFSASQYNMMAGTRSYPTNEAPYSGSIDELMIFNRALSASEVTAVYELPMPIFSVKNACTGTDVNFVDSSFAPAGSTYRWSFGDNSTSTSKNPSHTYAKAGTYKVYLKITSPSGSSDSIFRYVTAYALPRATFVTSENGLKVQFIPADTSLPYYSWDFGDSASDNQKKPVHTFKQHGTYVVTVHTRNSSGCDSIFKKTITLVESLKADFDFSNACAGTEVSFTDKSQAGSSVSYHWDFGDNTSSTLKSPTHTFTTAGKYKVSLKVTASQGVSDTISKFLTIHELPVSDFTVSTNKLKAGFTISDSGVNTYLWDFGDTFLSVLKNPVHTYEKAGSYTVRLDVKNANGCITTVKKTINVFEKPKASFGASNACVDEVTHFTDSSESQTSSLTYAWSFGDNTSSAVPNPSHIYTAPGTYVVSLKATNSSGQSDSVSRQVIVYALPVASFTTSINMKTVRFVPTDSTLAAYSWDFGDTNNSFGRNPVHTYTHWGTYTVTLTARNEFGCDSTSTQVITLSPSGIEDDSKRKLEVLLYPNPVTHGELNLEIKRPAGDCHVRIMDMQGRECYNAKIPAHAGTRKTINLRGYKSGIYLLTVISEQGVFYGKVVVR